MEERRLTATASRSQQRRRTTPGAAEAAAAWRPWGDVPDNILVRISAFLPCRADRVHMAAVNRLWRSAVLGLQRPPPPVLPPLPAFPAELPWIIFPSTAEPTFYNPIANRYQVLRFNNSNLPFPFYDIRRARCCGSGDGGWLVLALDLPHAYALYNLNSGDIIPLPDGFVVVNRMGTELLQFDMQAAALWTGNNPAPPYVVATIVRVGAQAQSTSAFWRHGGAIWFEPVGMPMVELQDLVWYGNSCYFLTTSEDVIEFWFEHPNGNATLVHEQYNIQRREDYNMDAGWIKRYIVVSEGSFLMVLRYAYHNAAGTASATNPIRVFQLYEFPEINGFEARHFWVELHDHVQLAGQMLFLGSGCSRTLEVDHYPYAGFEESMIFFLDERMAYIMSADGRRQYLFTDMGRYSMGRRTRVPWPPGHPGTSDNAPPTWWFH